ncbi:MFS family permease [Clostridium saccharoperbutylacetonicum]|uniref:Major facilitator superfamily n=1 Tax=Clostridium saccharoperbutylacetonicum N1-4(HMT) TaxID=931276 RepID=M1MLQ3_9CLOT|nr:MFS transporter [Clostridium saccharoperbutylacetonicum]AGF57168.1 major facilitator superfamily [Clostridium saccharoperbutylacetonicum N1-4(HMT)]NRT62073.1 MFS family permease [Clostridium saccharoperbutylacetonicum]NSB25403.1 MFS family permease [Clostridium saccharoperbutylacetonicum]NSB44771.1 MFS family permease [Clostridium saccharoperbutylacetonicum]
MNLFKNSIKELHSFLILWITQSLSELGSSMTNFALIIWSYQQHGSALITAMLSVCTYLPYVIMSIFAGALSDKWNKKITILVSDSFAALCTIVVLILLKTNRLEIWHIYCLNALNGLMNTIQQPAADVTISILTPKKHYQKVSGMRSFSNSLITIMTPIIATALLALTNMQVVSAFDLLTFGIAFISLLCFVKIPKVENENTKKESMLSSVKSGLSFLKHNRGILDLILFLAAINFTASIFNATLPAMILSRAEGGEVALGIINTVTGSAMLVGSIVASILPAPKSRVRVICNALLLSMSTENFFLAFGNSVPIWCVGAVLGWIAIPIMGTNMDVLLRSYIPIDIQGRVYSVRNTLQFFTIPIGYFLGGILVDKVFEPFMLYQPSSGFLTMIFGTGKGSGAALLFFILGILGVLTCIIFRRNIHIWNLEK